MGSMDINHSSNNDYAACGNLSEHLEIIGPTLDQFLKFEHSDAVASAEQWRTNLTRSLPERGIGVEGLRDRICRHNRMARWLARQAQEHPNLELVLEPTLSICCFRYIVDDIDELNEFNRQIFRAIVRKGLCIPSSAVVDGQFTIRPCFIGARTRMQHAEELLADVLEFGHRLHTTNTHCPLSIGNVNGATSVEKKHDWHL